MLEASQRARFLEKARPAPFEGLPVALGFGPHAHARVAVAELVGVVLLDGDRDAEIDVPGLVGDAEATGSYHPHDTIGGVEDRICRQSEASVHELPSRRPCRLTNATRHQRGLNDNLRTVLASITCALISLARVRAVP